MIFGSEFEIPIHRGVACIYTCILKFVNIFDGLISAACLKISSIYQFPDWNSIPSYFLFIHATIYHV